MNIIATLDACIEALGSMKLRVDQETEGNIARAVIRTLFDVKNETQRREEAAKAAQEQAAAAQEEQPQEKE